MKKPTTDERMGRRDFLRYSGALSAQLALGAGLLGCGQQQAAAPAGAADSANAEAVSGFIVKEGEPAISLFTTMADEYFTSHVAGTRQCAQALGLKYEGFVNENKPEVQLTQFETAAGRGVKLMTVIPPDVANVPELHRRANEYRVNTVSSAELPPWYFPFEEGEYSVAFVSPFDYESFRDVTLKLIEHIGGQGRVLMVSGFPGGTPDTLRVAAVRDVLAQNPNVKLLGSLPGKWNRIDGRKAFEDLMSTHPDFDAVICLNDEMAIGALSALEDAGRKNVPIIGHNGTTEIMGFIESGRVLASAATFPFWIGAYMVALAYDAANGWKPELPERLTISGHTVVDGSNVQVYRQKYVDRIDNLPFDFRRMSRTLHPENWDPQNLVRPMDVEAFFRTSQKPAGAGIPEAWTQALASGAWEASRKRYEDHYQRKIMATESASQSQAA